MAVKLSAHWKRRVREVILSQPCTVHGCPGIKVESESGAVSASVSAGFTSFLAAKLDTTVITILCFTLVFFIGILSQPCTINVIKIYFIKVFVKVERKVCIVRARGRPGRVG